MDPGQSHDPDHRPVYWLWVFDPQTAKLTITHNEDRPPAYHVTHKDLAPEVNHPERQEGYVNSIKGGYRITDRDHKPVTDPYIKRKIVEALDDSD